MPLSCSPSREKGRKKLIVLLRDTPSTLLRAGSQAPGRRAPPLCTPGGVNAGTIRRLVSPQDAWAEPSSPLRERIEVRVNLRPLDLNTLELAY